MCGDFQLGETKFPVQPSTEPKVVAPRIPFNSGIKAEPTKLIPISAVDSSHYKGQDPKTTASILFSSSNSGNPSTETTRRPTSRPITSTKFPTIGVSVNGPEYDTKTSYRQSQHPTTKATITSPPTRSRATSSPFRESIKVNEPSTVKVPNYTAQVPKVTSPESTEVKGPNDYVEDLLPPFRTTNVFDTQTTVGVPFNSFDPDNDLNVINSYANINPESRITTQSGFYSSELNLLKL